MTVADVTRALLFLVLPASPGIRVIIPWIVSLGLTIGVAALSYHYFEKPFLRLKKRFTFVPSRAA